MSHFSGKVSGFMPRTESGVFRKRQTLVWNFRIERYTTEGKPLPRVAVELRAKYYTGGSVNNGDVVEVTGRQSRNGIVAVRSVKNLTAGTLIRARKWNTSVVVLNLVGLLLFLLVVAGIARVVLGVAGQW
jgi:hypothetical protein